MTRHSFRGKLSFLTGCGAAITSVANSLSISAEELRSEVSSFNDISKRRCGLDFLQITSSELYSLV